MPRPYFVSKNKIKEILMVNHAGEFGAQQIYEGQLAFTKDDDRKTIQHMLEQELEHLKYFENEIKDGKSRPTILLPLWSVLGYALGALSALAGTKTSMLVTESIEEVIVGHYHEQIEYLKQVGDHSKLLSKIKQFKQEEAQHIEIAIKHDSKKAILHNAISKMVKGMCNMAIYLSKRI
jgi:ubiquinone biosynthesis monooxygenase Coq7